MVAVPAATPVIMPEELPAIAIAVLLLLQVPNGVTSVYMMLASTHTVLAPDISAGSTLVTAGVTV
jgi:hypothetical protein